LTNIFQTEPEEEDVLDSMPLAQRYGPPAEPDDDRPLARLLAPPEKKGPAVPARPVKKADGVLWTAVNCRKLSLAAAAKAAANARKLHAQRAKNAGV